MKKVLLILTLLALAITGIMAAETQLIFSWETNDDEVTQYRYILDDELKGNWTVVDSSVTSVTYEDFPEGVEHTLYVQATYDGENWSESGSATATPTPLIVYLD